MTDLIIGAAAGYSWQQLAPFVNSLCRSGFSGTKALFVRGLSYETEYDLVLRGFTLLPLAPSMRHINMSRFACFEKYLADNAFRYVVCVDVRDLVFQSNPIAWLEEHFTSPGLVAASECIAYENEPWGNDNMRESFPAFYSVMCEQPSCCAGTIAGDAATMRSLFQQIHEMSVASSAATPDQAAYNILLRHAFSKRLLTPKQAEGWACMCGTVVARPELFGPYLLESRPTFDAAEGLLHAPGGKPFSIVHQYDRTEWRDKFERKYCLC